MTNEERQRAIEWMKGRPVMMAGAKKMYDLAVEALKAYVPDIHVGNMEPSCESDKEITRCSDDTISRQAVIDLLKQMRKDGDMVPWEGKNVFARIRKLPSAQPKRKTGYKINQHQYPAKWVCSECGSKHFDFSDNFCSQCGADVRGDSDGINNVPLC
jgi:rubrerythrin